jgi:alkanesulfonate monooxygenase SsuD/methylene tetrahydromethanopterin reductase-like flavin-dependent oxidoreductase (luciferase family)
MARRLSVGVQFPEVERQVPWPEYRSMARAAEEVGFDSIWLGDHLLYRGDGLPERGPWEAWTLLTALAASTDRVQVGTLVTCTAFHLPGVLAKAASTLYEVSGGRSVLGLGAGWNEAEFRAFGIPFDHRASRFEEAFEIIRRLLSGDRVTFDGRFHSVDDAVLMPRPSGRPQLMIGSTGERILRSTLPHVDAWNIWYDWYGNTPEGFASASDRITRLAEEVGRNPDGITRSACVQVVLDRSSEERPIDSEVPPLEGAPERIAHGLLDFLEAGADEAILVPIPNNEASIRQLGKALASIQAGSHQG